MKLHIYTDLQSISSLRDEWLSLEQSLSGVLLFQSWVWCENFINFSKGDENFSPYILAVKENEHLLAIFPLCIQQGGKAKVLTGLCEPFQHYTDILVDQNADFEKISELFFAALKDAPADYCHFGQVREDSDLARILKGKVEGFGEAEIAPFIEFDKSTNMNISSIKPSENVKSQLAKKGELLSSIIDSAYAGREGWFERLGITSRAYANTDLKAFLSSFKNVSKTGVNVLGIRCMQKEALVSDQLGFVYKGRYYNFISSITAQADAPNAETLHAQNLAKTCFDQKIKVVDFLSPASQNELALTNKTMLVQDYLLPLNFKGKIIVNHWLAYIKPTAKKLVVALKRLLNR